MPIIIYLDESGDLGFNFSAPFRSGGSSRFLTIGALCVDPQEKHLPKRLIKNLYRKFKWDTTKEKKWSGMSGIARAEFASEARVLCDRNPDIRLRAITVKKTNVQEHIANDSNKLYNYMIRLMLLDFMAKYDRVTLVPDPRSIKVKSGNSLTDYLQTELWFTKEVKTRLSACPQDSQLCLAIQFTDMLAGLVRCHHEDGEQKNFESLRPRVAVSRLFFG